MDAWHLLGTAKVLCCGCRKVRSLDGDCAHRDASGTAICESGSTNDDDMENVPIVDKGKGRAY